MLDATCSPMYFASCPTLGTTFTDEMNLIERIVNSFTGMFAIYFRNQFILPKIDSLAAQIWTNITLPPIKQIERNVSLFITNTHSTMYHNYPKSNAIIEAAGLHLVPPKPLPEVRIKCIRWIGIKVDSKSPYKCLKSIHYTSILRNVINVRLQFNIFRFSLRHSRIWHRLCLVQGMLAS